MERELYYSKDGTKVMVVAPIVELERIIDNMDRFKYKYDHLLVIGNGFDLNLGLPTSYRNFVESSVFKKMYVKRMHEKRAEGNTQPSLIDYLYGKKFCERWYDIEQALLEYVSRKPDGSFVNNIEVDQKDYELVCNALIGYFANILKSLSWKTINTMCGSPAGQLLKELRSSRSIVYTFNYTPTDEVLETLSTIKVHGKIEKDTIAKGEIHKSHIILGIETKDINNIAPGYTFLLKSNNAAFCSSQIAMDLLQAKNVMFFGHSLNQMDFGYFKEYFNLLESNTDKERTLTIVTKDNDSRVALFDNLRKMGISVRDIYARTNVNIILTDKLDDKESEDSKKFNTLLKELE